MIFDKRREFGEKHEGFLAKVQSVPDMNANEIKAILQGKSASDGKISISERNPVAYKT